MSIIDENLARIFLQATPLKSAVLPATDLCAIEEKVNQFGAFVESFIKNSTDNLQRKSFLQKELMWSLSKCNEYLELLLPEKTESDCLQIENRNTVIGIIKKYKEIITRVNCCI